MPNDFRGKTSYDTIQREMGSSVLRYWGLMAPPFDNVPNPDLVYLSAMHREGILRLFYAIKGSKGLAMLTGEVGGGKTTLCRLLIKRLMKLNYEVALVNNPTFSALDFLREIVYQLGVENIGSDKFEIYHLFNDLLLENAKHGKETVIFIDEAQAIRDVATFEELRMLLNFHSNEKFLFTLVLIGQPNLRNMVSRICQFEQRIAVSYHLPPLSLVETARYINYRMSKCGSSESIFTSEAFKMIYRYTSGIPRLINHLCDMCLLSGYLSKVKKIDRDTVEYVTSDKGLPIYENSSDHYRTHTVQLSV